MTIFQISFRMFRVKNTQRRFSETCLRHKKYTFIAKISLLFTAGWHLSENSHPAVSR